MASINPNAPYGFRVIANPNGDYPVINNRTASASISVPTGCIAYQKTDGTVAAWNGSFATAKLLIGPVVSGCRTSTADRTIQVIEDPNVLLESMLDDASVTGINGLVGRNFRHTDLTSVSFNATLNQSTQKIDASTGSKLNGSLSTNVRPFQAIRFSREVGNVSSQSFARAIFRIRPENHIYGTATTTV